MPDIASTTPNPNHIKLLSKKSTDLYVQISHNNGKLKYLEVVL